ncbi:hypothetical protein L208DRAFT_1455072 [Tricholoma matsutake]|nr:hypothetical protein L208DRAFT_1455072 [Tricholoma matsutake 945]
MDPSAAVWHIPQISISPAPPEETAIEPYSPFQFIPVTSGDEASFRSRHLTPPPTLAAFDQNPLYPGEDDTLDTSAVAHEPFQPPLQASTNKDVGIGGNRAGGLQKKIVPNAHIKSQAARRAIFLSRILAPPSPTATLTPKTPPDSPAIFHYTLPSPGLISPIAHFETLERNSTYGVLPYVCEPWVEQIDFRSSRCNNLAEVDGKSSSIDVARDYKGMPSLDQISARMNFQGHLRTKVSAKYATRLPAFLLPSDHDLCLPLAADQQKSSIELSNSHIPTTIVPRSDTMALPTLSESTLCSLDSRARKAYVMVSTLKRRTISTEHCFTELDRTSERSRKRYSAPADLSPFQERDDFKHPVLLLPGGF